MGPKTLFGVAIAFARTYWLSQEYTEDCRCAVLVYHRHVVRGQRTHYLLADDLAVHGAARWMGREADLDAPVVLLSTCRSLPYYFSSRDSYRDARPCVWDT